MPVSIHADPSRPNVYSFAAGYATDTGARGIISWQDRRVNSYGHKMSVDLEAAQVTKYSLQSRYIIPIGDPAVENLTLAGDRRAAPARRRRRTHHVASVRASPA